MWVIAIPYFPPPNVHIMPLPHHPSAPPSVQFSVTLLQNMIIKASLMIITNSLPPLSNAYWLRWNGNDGFIRGLFPSIWPIRDLEALLRHLRGADPRAQTSSTCVWICRNSRLIYAASWTQLFPISTAVKRRGDADSLKTDWMPLLVFIWGACHQCVDWRWMFLLSLWRERPAELCEFGPCGRCSLSPSSLILPFLPFPPFCVVSLWSCWEPSQLATLALFSLPPWPSVSSPPLSHLSVLHSRGPSARLSWPRASCSIGPIVYSLHPDTKDIKLTDQRAGARARLINEALGSGGGWMEGRRRRAEGGLDR